MKAALFCVVALISAAFANAQRCSLPYRQCGGASWTGSTCCVRSVCVYRTDEYSQCLPASASASTSTTKLSTTTTKLSTTTTTPKASLEAADVSTPTTLAAVSTTTAAASTTTTTTKASSSTTTTKASSSTTTTKASSSTTKTTTTTIAPATAAAATSTPTVYLCGDSTMANAGSSSTIAGWGTYLPTYLGLPIVNKAAGGRSSRSYTREGKFDEVAALLKPGDVVIIEFGHNDGGGVQNPDNGRGTLVGTGNETVTSVYNNVTELVHTYPYYIQNAALLMQSKGAKVIISSPTPNNGWDATNTTISTCSRFCGYAELSATNTGSMYVNHYAQVALAYQKLGKAVVDTMYSPDDHTHTLPAGADVVAKAYITGTVCKSLSIITSYLTAAGKAVTGTCA